MFDKIRRAVDHAGDKHVVVGQRVVPPNRPFMSVPRVSGLKQESSRLRLDDDREDPFQWYIACVRALVVSPAYVNSHFVRWDISQRVIESLHVTFGSLEKVRLRQRLVHSVSPKSEIWAVELQDQ